MKTRALVSCLVVGLAGVGCTSSPRDFSEGEGGPGPHGDGASAPSDSGGAPAGGAASGGTQALEGGASGAPEMAGAPSGGVDSAGGASGLSGAAGEGQATGPDSCSADEVFCEKSGCADLATDPSNCGRCGHDCGALSTCDNARCTPAPLVTGLTNAQGLDVSAKGLFYTTANTIQHCTNPAKCAATLTQVGAPSSASTLAVTKTLPTDVVAFYGRNAPSDKYAGYHTCPTSGCAVTSLANLGPSGAVSGLLGDGPELFYQSAGNAADLSTSSLVKLLGTADGTQGSKLIIGNRAKPSARIAVDDGFVYYVRVDQSDVANVVACSRATGCGDKYVSLKTGDPTNFAAFGGKLYWQNGVQLKQCDATDPASATPVATLPGAYDRDMLVDGKHIYWLTPTSLSYCALPGCTGGVKILASGLDSPTALRQWGDYLYWLVPSAADASRGAAYRIAKP